MAVVQPVGAGCGTAASAHRLSNCCRRCPGCVRRLILAGGVNKYVGVSTVNTEQAKVLAAFKVKKPDANAQMPLL